MPSLRFFCALANLGDYIINRVFQNDRIQRVSLLNISQRRREPSNLIYDQALITE